MAIAIKPLEDRIVIKINEAEEKTASGLVIPDTAKEKPMEAIVVAVGEGKYDDTGKRIPMSVKEGQKVLIGKYSGTEVKLELEDHVIVREDEILAILN